MNKQRTTPVKRFFVTIDDAIYHNAEVTAAFERKSMPKFIESVLLEYFKRHPVLPSMEEMDRILQPKIAASEVSNFTTPTIDVKA